MNVTRYILGNIIGGSVYRSAKLISYITEKVAGNFLGSKNSSNEIVKISRNYKVISDNRLCPLENDFRKIGDDFFKVLNRYEKSRNYRITER